MRFRRGRIIQPEILDDQPPEASEPSLRDLVRINELSGAHEILRSMLERVVTPADRFTMLDVGAASGDTATAVTRRFPHARVVSLDYRTHHLRAAPPPRVSGDAFALPFTGRPFDFVYCSLFLHHFSARQIVELLWNFAALARQRVLISDLERHWIPFYFLPVTKPIYGWNPITLHDGPISVQAGFRKAELAELAAAAGLRDIDVRAHRPAFRLALSARP
jgi:hypothetical protein